MTSAIKTVAAATLGCKVNFVETEGVLELFRKAGYGVVDFSERADVYVINTCTVTAESGKKSRQMISRAKKTAPNAVIAVIGCYSELEPEKIDADVVIGTADRGRVVELVQNPVGAALAAARLNQNDTPFFEELPLNQMTHRTRAFVKIQDGCENYCAYCIIPYARGGCKSRPLGAVVDEVTRLTEKGCKEVVLTGIHLASYGKNEGITLINAVNAVCAINGVNRVRLGSLDPAFVTAGFAAGLKAAGKVCPHFHLPLQSGSGSVLRRMNRKYDKKQFEYAANALRGAFPRAAITTDVIAGFPAETNAEFEESLTFIESQQFSKLHVFPYSKREKTAAAKMPGHVSSAVKKERAKRLVAVGERLHERYKALFHNAELDVLVEEKTGKNEYRGLSGNYLDVRVVSQNDVRGEIMSVEINKSGCILL